MSAPKVTLVVWLPDGTQVAGATAQDALEALGALQWAPVSGTEMAAVLTERAAALGMPVPTHLPPDELLGALHAAKLLRVDRVPSPGR